MKQQLWLTIITWLIYCIDQELYRAIDYLKEQVRVLIEQQDKQKKRILLTNRQRLRVAAKAKRLSRDMLDKTTVLFTPDTVIGWYRKLIAQKYDGSINRRNVGRPQISKEIITLVIQFKKQNQRWGYQKITDQLIYLGYHISKSAVKNGRFESFWAVKPGQPQQRPPFADEFSFSTCERAEL